MTDPRDAQDGDDDLLRALGALHREQEADLETGWPSERPDLGPLKPQEAAQIQRAVHPPRTRRLWAAGLVAAAAVLAFALWPASRSPNALPAYTVQGTGDALTRSEPVAATVRYTPHSRVLLIATPDSPAGAVAARVYVEQNGERRRVHPQVDVSPDGAVRVDAEAARDLGLRPGRGTIVLLIRPADFEDADTALLDRADPAPAVRLRHAFEFSSAP